MNNFSDIYSPEKIKEILEQNKPFYHKKAFRIIKHSRNKAITKEDFYPSIMEYNNFQMPDYNVQNRKNNLQLFGTSCYESLADMMNKIESTTSLRNSFEDNGWFVVEGTVNKDKGFADKPEENDSNKGHFVYYIFDPIRNSPVNDFSEVKEADNDE